MGEQSDYLSRALVEGVVFEISENFVSIRSPNTDFLTVRLDPPLEKAALLEQYRRVLCQAKANEIRISYTAHLRKTICESWKEYEISVCEKQRLFQEIMELAHTVERRGIHLGWRDDTQLEQMHQLQSQFQRYGWGGSAIAHINSAAEHLKWTEASLFACSDRPDMIFL